MGGGDTSREGAERLRRVRECRDCGLFQELPELGDVVGATARCGRCGAVLRRVVGSLGPSLASAAAAAALFAFALELPFLDMRILSRFARAMLLTGPAMLGKSGAPALAVAVFSTLIVGPAVRLALILTVLGGLRLRRPPTILPSLFGWAERLAPWAMIDVFLLGVIVAYSRLSAWAQIDVGSALVALAGAMVVMVAADAALDAHAVWDALEEKGLVSRAGSTAAARSLASSAAPAASQSPAADGDAAPPARAVTDPLWMGCLRCDRVSRGREGEPCARCGHPLSRRKKDGPTRTWALVVAAVLLYVPANALPVMTVRRFGHADPNTILSGIAELAANHLWPLAILVFVASFTVPMLKLVGLATMLVMARRRSDRGLVARTRLFRFILVVGRWSMIDVFALTTLVAAVQMGFLATVLPGDGATAFCGVVLLTMLATELFDPRVMWDAAGAATCADRLDALAVATRADRLGAFRAAESARP